MKTLAILFVHNRPMILQECIRTLLSQNDHRFTDFLVINDNSKPQLTDALNEFTKANKFNLINLNKGEGYAEAANLALHYAQWKNPDYLFWIEQDYIFREHAIDIVLDIVENQASGQNAIGFSGYNNPDWFSKRKRDVDFPRIQKENFIDDDINRGILWKPWEQETKYGKFLLQYVSNSCGTMFIDWRKVSSVRDIFPKEYQKWHRLVCDMDKVGKRNLNDGAMSGGLCHLWLLYQAWHHREMGEENSIHNLYGALLDVMPSLANHVNGGAFDPEVGEASSINGHIVPEGHSFVASPTWNMNLDQVKQYLKETKYCEEIV